MRARSFYAMAATSVAALALSACEIEGAPSGGAGAAGASAVGGAGAAGGASLPATIELRARWGDAGVQETLAQEGASLRRVLTREGVGQAPVYAPAEAARAMGTGKIELGLYSLPLYAFARPDASACLARVDVSIANGALRYKLSADEPTTQSACQAFMNETSRGAEIVYEGVPVAVSSAEVQAPALVTVRVVFSP